MPRRSAGLLVFRRSSATVEVVLAHPGGPFWAKKDAGAWSIPKGEYESDEPALDAARREFTEELGMPVPDGTVIDLGEITQKGGKIVTAFAVEADLDVSDAVSNTFEMVWPPRSGVTASFPEVDRVEWFAIDVAREKILAAQQPFLDRLPDQG
ncbi:NUDIX domain-containing protein [Williamsia phyllosphaerae]|uniref:DNA mismatch repair protein MutT n=1 Tax=Williamsia phyllosphaerae TaxID=885042 RepID=A0ABQ1V1E4_9NOCA|nr:NUDIX domain-containing protein [Williamsia phyllosphaerae]GGF33744.1 DNA mismatch repair protein MutT [Williamsia phyllosphaerae]